MDSQLHTSDGKINTLLFVDTSPQRDPKLMYAELSQRYGDIFRKIASHHAVEIIVLFDLNLESNNSENDTVAGKHDQQVAISSSQTFLFNQTKSRLRFICINKSGISGMSIAELGSHWIQDSLLVKNSKTWYYRKDDELIWPVIQSLKDRFPESGITAQPYQLDFGNMLTGRWEEKEYIVYGSIKNQDECNSISQQLNIIPALDLRLNITGNVLFHLDLFLSIVGPVEKANTVSQLILLAEPVYFDNSEPEYIDEVDSDLSETENALLSFFENAGIPTITEYVPLLVLKNQGRPWLISYNNCLIENYDDNGRKLIFYFPDYENVAREMVAEIPDDFVIEQLADSMSFRSNSLAEMPFKSKSAQHKLLLADSINKWRKQKTSELQAEIKTAESRIKNILSKYNVPDTQIHFINCNFFNLSKDRGALHCISKVLHRD